MRRWMDSKAHVTRFVPLQSWQVVSHLARSNTLTSYWASSTCTSGLSSWASMKAATENRSNVHSSQFPNETKPPQNPCDRDYGGYTRTHDRCRPHPFARVGEETHDHCLQRSELRLLQELDRASGQARVPCRREGHP